MALTPKEKKPRHKGDAAKIVDDLGIDAICSRLTAGITLTEIARENEIGIATLMEWISRDSERSVRVREARIEAAKLWDELATDGIRNATDPFELAKAKEIAHHYRWRASKIAPKEYGDKITQEVTGANGTPIEMFINFVKPE